MTNESINSSNIYPLQASKMIQFLSNVSNIEFDLESVNGPVFEAHRDDASALAVLHKQVKGKVLDEVIAVVPKRNYRPSTVSIFV